MSLNICSKKIESVTHSNYIYNNKRYLAVFTFIDLPGINAKVTDTHGTREHGDACFSH